MELNFLKDLVVIFSLSALVSLIFHKINVPALVGYLITGMIVGPHGLSLVSDIHIVEILAEVGIIFLMFTIGIEFSYSEIPFLKREIFISGPFQVFFSIFTFIIIALIFGKSLDKFVFFGMLISLSSTAIVLKLLIQRDSIPSPHGKTSLGILLFQDTSIVPMILFLPLLVNNQNNILNEILFTLFKSLSILVIGIGAARLLIPPFLFQVTRTRNRELFLISIIMICLGTAWFTSLVGLSLALGAFLSGLMISESPYVHQALSDTIPLRDLFTSLFFVSIGMLVNLTIMKNDIFYIMILTVEIIFIKTVITAIAVKLLGYPLRTAIYTGLLLSQIGEFSFILAQEGLKYNLITADNYQTFLAVAVLSMIFTPFIFLIAPKLATILSNLFFAGDDKTGSPKRALKNKEKLNDHIIIIGYGINGKNLVDILNKVDIPYIVIEMNPSTVKREKRKGINIFFGDGSKISVLKEANIAKASVAVIAISDKAATQRVVDTIKRINNALYTIVRIKYLSEIKIFKKLGADDIVAEDLEASVAIFSRVLTYYSLPDDNIKTFINQIRKVEKNTIFKRKLGIRPATK